jgi:carboxyl-terminal processing protease
MPYRLRLLVALSPLFAASLSCRTILGEVQLSSPSPDLLSAARQPSDTVTITTPIYTSITATLTPSPTYFPSYTRTPSHTLTYTPVFTSTLSGTLNPSLALQMQVFEDLWTIIDENYLYPDFNGVDWDAIHQEYRQRIEVGVSNQDFYSAMKEMVYRLGDDHSSFLSPEEAREQDVQYAGEYDYAGIGVMVSVVPERNVATILLVFPSSPAERAGLLPHDSILAIDGQPIVDEQGNLRRELLRGPEGTTIQVTIHSPGQPNRQVPVTRERIDSPLPVPHQVFATPSGKRIGYIFLPTFNDERVDDLVEVALKEMSAGSPLEGLILDDRQNGGGSSQVLLDTLVYFTNGPVGSLVQRQNEQPLSVTGKDVEGSQSIPLLVMIGKGALSFGEVFAGIIKDLGRADLIGEQTTGNVEVLTLYNFTDGSRALIANMTFRPYNHPGQDWEVTGITPDLVVPSDWDQVTLETDPAIQAALEYFD